MFLIDFFKFIIEFFFSLTTSYGWSIILLSLLVTVIMLPLFWISEFIQKKERARKLKMQPALNKLKDVTNKLEKYYYTRTIFRQHGYFQLYSLSSLLGLLVQLPFFLAAYWMLLSYPPIKGVSFGPIKDLSLPDNLLSIRGLTINFLPFLMTAANLIAGFLYSKKKILAERLQLIVISLSFLVLLYDLPAILVLYWTMNNIFSIGKNWLIQKNIINQNKLHRYISSKWKNNKYMVSPILFSIFPLLSLYIENIGELYFSKIIPYLFAIIPSTIGILLLSKFIFKDRYKAVVFGFILIILFFSFGHLFIALIDIKININRKGLFMIYMLILFSLFYFIFKSKKQLQNFYRVLHIFSVSLFLKLLMKITLHHVSTFNNEIKLDLADNVGKVLKKKVENNIKDSDKYPDIFYIVMDGYANSKVLKKYVDFENSDFENFLKKKGFYIATEGRCNYILTFLSLAATLNMKHINHLGNDIGLQTTDRKVPYQMISQNKVMNYLSKKGYKNINFSSGWEGTNKLENANHNFGFSKKIDHFSITFLQTTILYPFFNYFSNSDSSTYASTYRKNILYALDNLSKLDRTVQPKFVFAHIVCPHPPYVFDENGEAVPGELKLDNTWNEKEFYKGQIKFINNKMKKIVENILKKDKNAVIILQSDHGSAFFADDWTGTPSPEFIEERGMNFNAILINNKNLLYPNISSVNTFPVIFNSLFNENFELLKDSTFFSNYKKPYNFTNVTSDLNPKKK